MMRKVDWMLVAALAAGCAQAAPAAADGAGYEAACTFIGAEVARLDAIVAKKSGADVLLRTDPQSGASLFRRQGEGVRIDYLITGGGKVIVSQAELKAAYFGSRLTPGSLKKSLRLAQDLPASFQTGCDGLSLSIKKTGQRIASLTIDVDVD